MTNNRWLIITLALSIACNFALIGFFAGRSTGMLAQPIADPMFTVRRLVHNMEGERRRALEPRFEEHFRGIQPNVRQMHDVQVRLNQAITAEPFVVADVTTALAGFRQELYSSMEAGHGSLVALLEEMTPAERVAFARQSRQRPKQHGKARVRSRNLHR